MHRLPALCTAILIALLVSSCTSVVFVQPYDQALVSGTEAFYKKAGKMIQQAEAVSPDHRAKGTAVNPAATYDHLKPQYDDLVIDANALIIRAAANANRVDALGQKLQGKLEQLVEKAVPPTKNCIELKDALAGTPMTLTVSNFVDLKCLVAGWDRQQREAPGQILTKTEWSNRNISLMEAIMAIETAETFKKKDTGK